MKQTKPFGRAYIPVAERMAALAQESETVNPVPPEAEPSAFPNGPSDLYSMDAVFAPYTPAPAQQSWRTVARAVTLWALMVAGAACVYVLLRDSVLMQNLLQQVTTEDTVMVCKDGKMVYEDYSVLDRLLNNGRFLCTEWKVQRGFLTLPRH